MESKEKHVPEELYRDSTKAINAIIQKGDRFFVSPNITTVRTFIEVSKNDYFLVQEYWDNGNAVGIEYNGGILTDDNSISNAAYRIAEIPIVD